MHCKKHAHGQSHTPCGCTESEILYEKMLELQTLLLQVLELEVKIMATQQDLDAAQTQTAQTVAQLKADNATLVDLVNQLIAKIGTGTAPDLSAEVAAEAQTNTDVQGVDTATQGAIQAAKTALGQ